jgi:hypothetical protein
MRVAIMQPYFLPYIGYFQLIAAVDVFVVYDNIKYTKKGWINRNRMLRNGGEATFTLPLRKGSDALQIRERELAPDFDRAKLLNPLAAAYRRAPFFDATWPLVEAIVRLPETNLFRFLHPSIVRTCEHLGITTQIRISSTIDIDHNLTGQDRVLALCEALGASAYLNPFGGMKLYSKEAFHELGIELRFIRPRPFEYRQFDAPFVPWLSILDVMMFHEPDTLRQWIASGFNLT